MGISIEIFLVGLSTGLLIGSLVGNHFVNSIYKQYELLCDEYIKLLFERMTDIQSKKSSMMEDNGEDDRFFN